MSAETLLNPEVFEILKYIKEQYPKSTVILLSNGTIPPKNPEIVRYIDILEFSIDGGSSEVYEKIRTPAKFARVEKNLRAWIHASNQYKPDLEFGSCTTLSTLNMTDLPNIVRFLGELAKERVGRRWNFIYLQSVVIQDYQDEWLKKITLDHVEPEEGNKALRQALDMAKQYGIRIDLPDSIKEFFGEKQAVYDEEEIRYMQRFCQKLKEGTVVYDASGKQKFVCCFMRREKSDALLEKYGLKTAETAEAIYNSEGYWTLRRDLLEGKLGEACTGCMIGCSDYFRIRQAFALEIDAQRQKMVEKLFDMIDAGRTSYEDLKCITYAGMAYLKQVCDTMTDGMEMYEHIWEKMVQGLFESYTYAEPCIFYHREDKDEIVQLQYLSVVMLAAECSNRERMTLCMKNHDYEKCAKIICEQMQEFC